MPGSQIFNIEICISFNEFKIPNKLPPSLLEKFNTINKMIYGLGIKNGTKIEVLGSRLYGFGGKSDQNKK